MERIAVHEEEVRRPAFDDSTGLRLAQHLAATDRRGRERLRRLQSGLDERLDLPGEVVRAKRPAAKIRPGRDPHAGAVGQLDALDRPLPPPRSALLPLVADEPW